MQPVKAPSRTEVAAGHEKNHIHPVDPILSPGDDVPFATLGDLVDRVEHLQHELAIARPDQKLSGRIIQVAYTLPFTIQPLSECKYMEHKVEALAAADKVAQLAIQARARRAQREAQPVGGELGAIAWGMADRLGWLDGECEVDVAFRLERDTFRGADAELQRVGDVVPAGHSAAARATAAR